MRRGHNVTHPASLELPDSLDPCGVPCLTGSRAARRASPHRRRHPTLPGLAPTSVIASVEAVAVEGEREWLLWGSVSQRPVLVAVESGVAAEMVRALSVGETATAIVEPWQVVLERLD